MKNRILWLLVSTVITASMLLMGCSSEKTPTTTTATTTVTATTTATATTKATATPTATTTPKAGAPKYGGSLVLATVINNSMNFIPDGLATSAFQAGNQGIFNETLGAGDLRKGPTGTNLFPFYTGGYVPPDYVIGLLATSWELKDSLTLIVYLRKGVYFQSNPNIPSREMVANDMVVSWSFFRDSKTHDNDYFRNYVGTVTAIDKYTVEVKFKSYLADILSKILYHRAASIYPAELFTTYKDKLADFHYSATGTGPFIIEDFVKESSITFRKNPNYWGLDPDYPNNRLPYIDNLKFLSIADVSTRLSAFRTGKVDVLGGINVRTSVDLIKTIPTAKFTKALGTGNPCAFSMRWDYKPFDDIRVRKAMIMAIDYKSIIDNYLMGQGIMLNTGMSPTWTVYTPLDKMPADVQEMYTYNPVKAKALLAEAGYPKGFETEVVIQEPQVERAQIMTAFWEQNLNIKVNFKVVDANTWNGLIFGKVYTQMTVSTPGYTDPVAGLGFALSTSFYNYENYKSVELDRRINEMMATEDPVLLDERLKSTNIYLIQVKVPIRFPLEYVWIFWQPWLNRYGGENQVGYGLTGPIWARTWIDQDAKFKAIGQR